MGRIGTMIKLSEMPFSEESYLRVMKIAEEIFVTRQEIYIKGSPTFQPTDKENAAQELIYEFSMFGSRGIPLEEWLDIAKEGMTVLKEFLKNDIKDYRSMSSYKQLMTNVMSRLDTLLKNPKHYIQLYDWMNE